MPGPEKTGISKFLKNFASLRLCAKKILIGTSGLEEQDHQLFQLPGCEDGLAQRRKDAKEDGVLVDEYVMDA